MKIIGSDYDGTLNFGGIDEKKLSAIERWRDAGNIFSLVSGRGPDSVLELYEEKKFGCDYGVGPRTDYRTGYARTTFGTKRHVLSIIYGRI